MKNKSVFTLCLIDAIIFFGSIIYGIYKLFDPTYISQAILIIIESSVGFVICFLPIVLKKFAKIEFSFVLYLFIHTFLILAIFFGEILEFYYNVSWWDDILHVFSGFGIAFITYCVTYLFIKKTNINKKVFVSVFIACLVSIFLGVIWEITEFSLDSIFGTNMQKFVPQIPSLFNGGSSFEPLNGSEAEIAEFFKNASGYRYALLDTMYDLIDCFVGVAGFIIFVELVKHRFPKILTDLIKSIATCDVICDEPLYAKI